MAGGDHAFVEHGEDHELLLMDDVIDGMAGIGKTRNIRTKDWPVLAERWCFREQPQHLTGFSQVASGLGRVLLAYGESTNVGQIRLGIRRKAKTPL